MKNKSMTRNNLPLKLIALSDYKPQTLDEGRSLPPERKCGILYCRRGELEVTVEGKSYKVGEGDLFIYVNSAILSPGERSGDLEGMAVESDMDFALPVVMRVVNAESALRLKSHPCVKLNEEQKNRVETMLKLLKAAMSGTQLKESPQAERLRAELVKNLGRAILLEVMLCRDNEEQESGKPRGRKDVIFQNFMLSLFRHYKEQRSVGFYAKELRLSPRYLSNAVRDCSGQSASHWIVNMVVSEAKTLLQYSQLSVKEIADRLNFTSLSFFGRYFHLYVGMRPNEYRRTVK